MGARAIKPVGLIRTAPAAAIGHSANTRGPFLFCPKNARKARRPCRILATPK